MSGINCPSCGKPTEWASTTNEWEYVCKPCDARFNQNGERMPPIEAIRQLFPYTTTCYQPRQQADSPTPADRIAPQGGVSADQPEGGPSMESRQQADSTL
jgi:hypothetical protein